MNEAQNLEYVVPELADLVDEVVLVDGHSVDETVERARELVPSIHVVRQRRRGKGDALRATAAVSERLKCLDTKRRDAAIRRLVETLEPTMSSRPKPELMADWDDARALVARGFDVGSHSRAHGILAQEAERFQSNDLRTSRVRLSDGLQRDIEVLAYPNGSANDFDDRTIGAARAASYSFAVSTIVGVNRAPLDRFAIRRAVVDPERGRAGLIRPFLRLPKRASRQRRGGAPASTAHHSPPAADDARIASSTA